MRTFFGQGGRGLQKQWSALFGAKNIIFLKKGIEPVQTREEGVNFHEFVQTSFMDGLQ